MKYQITTERTDLFDVNMLVGMEITVKGQAKKDDVIMAYHRAVLSHEILNTKISICEDGIAYYIDNSEHRNVLFFWKMILLILFENRKKSVFT